MGRITAIGAVAFTMLLCNAQQARGQSDQSSMRSAEIPECDPATLACSYGQAPLSFQSRARLPASVDTNWWPACRAPDENGHCDSEPIQLRGELAFDPIKGSDEALLSVDMSAAPPLFEARWPERGKIQLSLSESTLAEGVLSVAHTLTPEFSIYIDTPFYRGEISVDAAKLISLLPGGRFKYEARNESRFKGWGLQPATVLVSGEDLRQAQLFSVSLDQLGRLIGFNFSEYLRGSFSFNATTRSRFVYHTKKVTLLGADQSIESGEGTASLPSPNQGSLDFMANAEGAITYGGELEMLPLIKITKIAGFPVNLELPIGDGLKYVYQSAAVPVSFPPVNVHIPLPDVYMTAAELNFGRLSVGKKKELKVTIENSGELAALISGVESTDPQFQGVAASARVEPNSLYELTLVYKPQTAGSHEATISVRTNDPDAPVQTLKVYGQADDPGAYASGTVGSAIETAQPAQTEGLEEQGGCQVAGGSSSIGALLVLAGLWLIRRRCTKRARVITEFHFPTCQAVLARGALRRRR